jgi:hypothetical protein
MGQNRSVVTSLAVAAMMAADCCNGDACAARSLPLAQ